MRILTISDIHGQYEAFNLEKLPVVDVILVAGDLTNFGMRPSASYQLQAERALEMARYWFARLHAHCPRIL
jgi:predicted phosphodiesterase